MIFSSKINANDSLSVSPSLTFSALCFWLNVSPFDNKCPFDRQTTDYLIDVINTCPSITLFYSLACIMCESMRASAFVLFLRGIIRKHVILFSIFFSRSLPLDSSSLQQQFFHQPHTHTHQCGGSIIASECVHIYLFVCSFVCLLYSQRRHERIKREKHQIRINTLPFENVMTRRRCILITE